MINRLNDAIADAHAEINDYCEKRQSEIRDRLDELLNNPRKRNLKLWKARQTDSSVFELTPKIIEVASNRIHDDIWLFSWAGLLAACFNQVFLEIMALPLLQIYETAGLSIAEAGKALKAEELRQHAKTGTPKASFDAAKERRKNGAAKQ